ncbi:hypothetical protein [Shimia sp. SDUM112013]|uniref:hypothetical protein n=1 Tax=Shimia sp. SDUM112013 TaxID=3136160 RepID=UPI0032EC829E
MAGEGREWLDHRFRLVFVGGTCHHILPYGTAKAALNQVIVSLAHMLNKRLRVTSVLIGTVMTGGNGDAASRPRCRKNWRIPTT